MHLDDEQQKKFKDEINKLRNTSNYSAPPNLFLSEAVIKIY